MAEVRAASPAAVSVIVPAYGVAPLLGEALASLQAQVRSDWEAVVVDDGSPDAIAEAFAPFAGDRRFRLLRTDNRGVATARNRAVAASGAPLIAFLDGDDAYAPDYLARMIPAIEADATLGFVSCDAVLFDGRERKGSRYSDRYAIAPPLSVARVLDQRTHVFTAAVVRRDAFEAVGGFDDALEAAEDLDLWIRLLAAGWHGGVVDAPLVRYRRRAGSLSSSESRLLASLCAVHRKSSTALAGTPEGAIAERRLAACAQQLRWLEGETAIRAGAVAQGLPLLAGAERRSPRWRVALALMRLAPGLARALLHTRTWLPTPALTK